MIKSKKIDLSQEVIRIGLLHAPLLGAATKQSIITFGDVLCFLLCLTKVSSSWLRKKQSPPMVAKSDRIINPDLERMYAKRANSVKIVKVEGASHSVYISHPKEVADLIISATIFP